MALQTADTIVDRVERVKHSIGGEAQPQAVQVAVDGPCPTEGCDNRIVADVRADLRTVACSSCGGVFGV